MRKATLLAGFSSIQEAMQHKGICRQRTASQQHSTAHCCVLSAVHDGRHRCLCNAEW